MLAHKRRIFMGFFPLHLATPLFFRMRGMSSFITKFFSDLKVYLPKAGYDFTPEDYVSFGIISYVWFGIIFGALLAFIGFHSDNPALSGDFARSMVIGILCGFLLIVILLVLLVMMPRIQARSTAKKIDQMLLYAMKDLLLQVNSGNTLYSALVSVSDSNYGEVSLLFQRAVRNINVGVPMDVVLREMIKSTDSEYLRRSLWQMISSLRAGADLRNTLGGVVNELNEDQKNQIMRYARELNLWSLFYMLFAVAIPTIGSTMLVILSTFAGFGVSQGMFIFFIILCFLVQFTLVMFVKSRRPVVHF